MTEVKFHISDTYEKVQGDHCVTSNVEGALPDIVGMLVAAMKGDRDIRMVINMAVIMYNDPGGPKITGNFSMPQR